MVSVPPVKNPAPPETSPSSPAAGVSDADRALLRLESRSWKHTATKEQAIRSQLGIEPTDYYLRLQALLSDPQAAREFPALLERLSAQVERAKERYTPQARLPQPGTASPRPPQPRMSQSEDPA